MPDALVADVSPFVSSEFAEDVRRDLSRTPKQLHPKYLYDELGSLLFAAICRMPWYRVARAEKRLLAGHGADLARAAGESVRVVELGCGTGEKLRIIADALVGRRRLGIHLVDVSPLALAEAAAAVRHLGVGVACHRETYERGLALATGARRDNEQLLVLFLGSNIGNFDPADAVGFLTRIRRALVPGDHLLLGVDLTKPERDLRLAYDDPLGLTAAFNKNLLVRMNRELRAGFALETFEHRAVWNAAHARVEMHLVSRFAQTVAIPGAGSAAGFEEGESIWTESSYKYVPEQVLTMAGLAGFETEHVWIEQKARFASVLLRAA